MLDANTRMELQEIHRSLEEDLHRATLEIGRDRALEAKISAIAAALEVLIATLYEDR